MIFSQTLFAAMYRNIAWNLKLIPTITTSVHDLVVRILSESSVFHHHSLGLSRWIVMSTLEHSAATFVRSSIGFGDFPTEPKTGECFRVLQFRSYSSSGMSLRLKTFDHSRGYSVSSFEVS
jgi:hypothetical protein